MPVASPGGHRGSPGRSADARLGHAAPGHRGRGDPRRDLAGGEWQVPLLMLHGGADLICLPAGAQAFARSVRPALVKYREYDGLFHEIHNEGERALVFGEIEAWLTARFNWSFGGWTRRLDRAYTRSKSKRLTGGG